MKKIKKSRKSLIAISLAILGLVLLPICRVKAADDLLSMQQLKALLTMTKKSAYLLSRARLIIKAKKMRSYVRLLHPNLTMPETSSTFNFLPSIIICSTLTGVIGGLIYEALMPEEGF